MKEILVEWRKFLLQERVSDYLVQELSSYYFNTILRNWQKYYDLVFFDDPRFAQLFPNMIQAKAWAKKKKDRIQKPTVISRTWEQNVLFGLHPKDGAFGEQSYKDFLQFQKMNRMLYKIGDDTARKEIILNDIDYDLFYGKIRPVFFSQKERPGAGADMASNGIMRIFVPDKFTQSFIASNKKMDASYASKMSSWLTGRISSENVQALLIHEFGHYVNSYRSGYADMRTSGSGKNTIKQFHGNKERHWYANSTEEIQARLTQIMYELNKRLFNRDPKILQLAQIDTFPKFKEAFLLTDSQYGQTFNDVLFYYSLSGKTKHGAIPLPPVPTGLPPLPPDLQAANAKLTQQLPPLPPDLVAQNATLKQKEAEAESKLTPKKKEEIKRKVDSRLHDIYEMLKKKYKEIKDMELKKVEQK